MDKAPPDYLAHFASLPQIFLNGLPAPPDRDDLPPWGWSTGFMASPRTLGRIPNHLFRPALPKIRFLCSSLPILPRITEHSPLISIILLEGSFTYTFEFSFFIIVPDVPAALIYWPPNPGFLSILHISVPTRIFPIFSNKGAGLPILAASDTNGKYFNRPPVDSHNKILWLLLFGLYCISFIFQLENCPIFPA